MDVSAFGAFPKYCRLVPPASTPELSYLQVKRALTTNRNHCLFFFNEWGGTWNCSNYMSKQCFWVGKKCGVPAGNYWPLSDKKYLKKNYKSPHLLIKPIS
jgi:hypothetical protein